jgi:hypothetical protein
VAAVAVAVVERAGVPEVVRPEPEVVPAAQARPERARAAVAAVRRGRDHQHQKARQAIHNAAPERPAREPAILVPAIPIDPTGAEPKVGNPLGAIKRVCVHFHSIFCAPSFRPNRSMSLTWTGVHAVMFAINFVTDRCRAAATRWACHCRAPGCVSKRCRVCKWKEGSRQDGRTMGPMAKLIAATRRCVSAQKGAKPSDARSFCKRPLHLKIRGTAMTRKARATW